MLLAIELAREAEKLDEVPIGAVLIQDGKIIGQGYNLREKSGKTTAHAEIQALEDYNRRTGQWRLPSGTSLFVTTEPCMMCTGALLWARADFIFYGAKDPKGAGLETFLSLIEKGVFDHRFKAVQGDLLGETCGSLLSDYFKRKRKQRGA